VLGVRPYNFNIKEIKKTTTINLFLVVRNKIQNTFLNYKYQVWIPRNEVEMLIEVLEDKQLKSDVRSIIGKNG